jgi:hypothetical protein
MLLPRCAGRDANFVLVVFVCDPLTRKPSQGSHALPRVRGRGRVTLGGSRTQGSASLHPGLPSEARTGLLTWLSSPFLILTPVWLLTYSEGFPNRAAQRHQRFRFHPAGEEKCGHRYSDKAIQFPWIHDCWQFSEDNSLRLCVSAVTFSAHQMKVAVPRQKGP